MTTKTIQIYDTTLRDGTQGEGVSLSLEDKLQIAQRLDEIGVDYIEGGYPLSNEKDEQFFQQVQQLNLKHAKVCAFGMTRRRGVEAAEDPGMLALRDSGSGMYRGRQNMGFPRDRSVASDVGRESSDD